MAMEEEVEGIKDDRITITTRPITITKIKDLIRSLQSQRMIEVRPKNSLRMELEVEQDLRDVDSYHQILREIKAMRNPEPVEVQDLILEKL